MTEKERMLAGKLYVAKDEELAKDFMRSGKQEKIYGLKRHFIVTMVVTFLSEKNFMPIMTV